MKEGSDGRTKGKILIVDDDPDILTAIGAVPEARDYQVVTAWDGEEGLVKLKEERPDLVLLDIIMPLVNGFQVCQQLKKDPQLAEIPVIMITCFSEKYMESSLAISQGLALEAEDFVDKPVVPAELLIRVEKLLKSRQ